LTESATEVGDDEGPVTYLNAYARRRERPLRELPHLIRSAIALVHGSAPREFRASVIAAAVAGVLTTLQFVVITQLLEKLTATTEQRDVSALLPWLLAFVAIYTANAVVGSFQAEWRRVLSELVTSHAQAVVALAAADADLVDFDRPAFHNRLQRALVNSGARPISLTFALVTIASAGLTAAGVLVALALVQPVMLIAVIVAVGPVWYGTKRATRLGFLFDLEETEDDRRRGYLLHVLTDKSAAKELRSYQLSGAFEGQHRRLWNLRISRVRDLARRRLRINVAARLSNSVMLAIILLGLVWLVSTDRISVSDAAVVAGAVLVLGQRLSAVVSGVGELYEGSLFLRDVESFLADSATQRAERGTVRPLAPFAEVRLDNVAFTYPAGADEALKGVSITVRRGEVVALVGANGSGKTTAAKVLAQLYRPSTGTVFWNGADATQLDPESLRREVAVIFQDFERYHFTAGENIAFGRIDDRDDAARIIHSAEQASAREFIEALSDGFDSLLGPEFIGGHDLSVGQWQRLAIARAFFRDAALVVLDEPSSALDPAAEAQLFENIRELCAGRGVVIISHRFSTVTSADRIYVLDHGRVIEQGSHRDLMDAGGEYARLFALQADRYIERSDDEP
jgi:ATP-binding cassette subfamily B protein